MKLTTATLGLAAISTVNAGLSGCAKNLALQATTMFGNIDTSFTYDYCDAVHDSRGYTSGIAGFSTAGGEAWEVVKAYHKLTSGKDCLSKFDSLLESSAKNRSPATTKLQELGYCSEWAKLGNTDAKFKAAQDKVRDEVLFAPSQKHADQLGLKYSITQAQLYDAAVQHGTGNDTDSLESLIKATNAAFTRDTPRTSKSTISVGGKKIDEIEWLKKFLEVRNTTMKAPHESENKSRYWDKTLQNQVFPVCHRQARIQLG